MAENREFDRALETPPARRLLPRWVKFLIAAALLAYGIPCWKRQMGSGIHSGDGWRMRCCSKATTDIRSLVGALNEYAADHGGSYPRDMGALLLPNNEGYSYLDLERAPLDPWGHEYFYEPPMGSRSFRVGSLGEDGEVGGDGYDQDIDNRTMEAEDWIRRISLQLKDYADLHEGVYPPSLEPLLRPCYLDCASVPLDPWGRPYHYKHPASGSPSFHVFTLGADGGIGGEGDDRDIANRPLPDEDHAPAPRCFGDGLRVEDDPLPRAHQLPRMVRRA